jgi:hypothetical protein
VGGWCGWRWFLDALLDHGTSRKKNTHNTINPNINPNPNQPTNPPTHNNNTTHTKKHTHRRYDLPLGDFPDVNKFRARLREVKDLRKFPKLDKSMVYEMDKVFSHDVPKLLSKCSHHHSGQGQQGGGYGGGRRR